MVFDFGFDDNRHKSPDFSDNSDNTSDAGISKETHSKFSVRSENNDNLDKNNDLDHYFEAKYRKKSSYEYEGDDKSVTKSQIQVKKDKCNSDTNIQQSKYNLLPDKTSVG